MGIIFSNYPQPYYPGVRPFPRKLRPRREEHYVKDSFKDLGYEYWKGKKIDVGVINFSVQRNKYANDVLK